MKLLLDEMWSPLREALDRLARRRGTTRAHLIRLAARRLIEHEQSSGEDPIHGLIGIRDAGPEGVSEEHGRAQVAQALVS